MTGQKVIRTIITPSLQRYIHRRSRVVVCGGVLAGGIGGDGSCWVAEVGCDDN